MFASLSAFRFVPSAEARQSRNVSLLARRSDTARSTAASAAAPRVRTVVAADAETMRAFVESMSPAARRCRFHGALRACSQTLARQLTEVDGERHVACVATVDDDAGRPCIVGEARFVVCSHDPSLAEFAIAVADDWQGRGLAERLMATLFDRARERGLRWLYGEVLGSNRRMLAFVQRLGFYACAGGDDDEIVRVERDVEALALPARSGLARWLAWMPHPFAH